MAERSSDESLTDLRWLTTPQTTLNRSTIFSKGSTNFGHDGSTVRSSSTKSSSYTKNDAIHTIKAKTQKTQNAETIKGKKTKTQIKKSNKKLQKKKSDQFLQQGTNPRPDVVGFDGIERWEVKVLEKRVGLKGIV